MRARARRFLVRVGLGGDPDEKSRLRAWEADDLRRLELHAATIVDVGAADGTPELYDAFPAAHLVLVEPNPAFHPALRASVDGRSAEFHQLAVGSDRGVATLNIDPDTALKSSTLQRTPLTAASAPTAPITVRVRTLDALFAAASWRPPIGLKLDTEGAEMDALVGASGLLAQSSFVISEVSVADRFVDGYRFEELVAYLAERGFRLRDVLNVFRLPSVGTVLVNALFERRAPDR